jgi:hypothetical protein
MTKIIQVDAVGEGYGFAVIALCEDGTLWKYESYPDGQVVSWRWIQLPPIPDREGGA